MFKLLRKLLKLLFKLPPLSILAALGRRSFLLNFGITYGYSRVFRICHIAGRYGGYKTSLAMLVGCKLWADGFVESFYSNINCVWNDDIETLPEAVDPKDVSAVVVFEEGGQFFESRRDVKNLVAFLRKMKLILLIPSVEPPTSRVTRLQIEPMYIFTSIGLPLVIYRTLLRGSRRADDRTSWFLWWHPGAVFGVYDTTDAPTDGKGLEYALVTLKDKLASSIDAGSRFAEQAFADKVRKGRMRLLLPDVVDVGALGSPDAGVDADRMEEIADRMAETIDGAAALAEPPTKRRRGLFS